jgi:hypothetical protein
VRDRRVVRFVTLAALVATGCDGAAKRALPTPVETRAEVAFEPKGAPPAQARHSGGAGEQGGPAAAAPGQAQGNAPAGLAAMTAARKLIRTGEMTLVVESFGKAADEVKRVAETHGGYLVESKTQRGAEDRKHGSLTVRVDAARFDAAVAALRALGDVRSESVSAQDVTKAYTDLETRLRVKRETAERLREILRTRTAGLSDVLQAERELARVTEETEQMEGERRFYDQQVALSTLAVTLQEPSALVEEGMFAPLSEALHDSVRVLAASLAAIVYATVFLAPWVLLLWIAWKLFRRARARRKAAAIQ